MGKQRETPFGTVKILEAEEICPAVLEEMENLVKVSSGPCRVGLTGGSTPQAFYKWIEGQHPFPGNIDFWDSILWSCSDERHVSLDDEDSNFGNAQRMMLDPLGFDEAHCRPWPVYCEPLEAAARFNRLWEEELPGRPVFDLCMLGMGEDCHTASIFPASPLLVGSMEESFSAVEVPGKGWRLTITPKGLEGCDQILVTVVGAGKAEALDKVFHGPDDPVAKPVQILKGMAEKVTWLIDSCAAAKL